MSHGNHNSAKLYAIDRIPIKLSLNKHRAGELNVALPNRFVRAAEDRAGLGREAAGTNSTGTGSYELWSGGVTSGRDSSPALSTRPDQLQMWAAMPPLSAPFSSNVGNQGGNVGKMPGRPGILPTFPPLILPEQSSCPKWFSRGLSETSQ